MSAPRLLLLVSVLIVALVAAPAGTGASATLKIATAQNATLGKRVLVTAGGRTLYSLSSETRGRFVCIDACLLTWPPLILKRGAGPTGVRGLSAIKRPDGRRQVTYKGRPLYRFVSDRRKGDAGGEGFRDVGVWHAAVAPR